MWDAVCTLAEIFYQTALFFIHEGHSKRRKSVIFGKLANVALFSLKFYAGIEKSLRNFCPPVLEQPIKFVLICFLFSVSVNVSTK